MAQVTLEHVTKVFPGNVVALDGLTLPLIDGELLVLVGPSGSGKTTLLRILAGLEKPTAGSVRLDGHDVTQVPPYQRDVAMLFQRPALYPHLTVRDNLLFNLRLGREPRADWNKRVDFIAELLKLTGIMNRLPAQLSGGQRQRVALGRALVRRPSLFLLDEPFSNLDLPLRTEMRHELHLLRRHLRATMVYVTHDQEEALALGDRVAVLDAGRVRQLDPPLDLYRRPVDRFVAGFLGWPPLVTLDGLLSDHDGRPAFAGPLGDWPGPVQWARFVGRRVTLGVRPEQVRLGARSADEVVVAMEVRLVEHLGPTDLVTLARDGWAVTLRRPAGATPPAGSPVAVAFSLADAHLFDAATGLALSHGRPEG